MRFTCRLDSWPRVLRLSVPGIDVERSYAPFLADAILYRTPALGPFRVRCAYRTSALWVLAMRFIAFLNSRLCMLRLM